LPNKINPLFNIFFAVFSGIFPGKEARSPPHFPRVLVKPGFLHKENAVVKNTTREKVGSGSKNVGYFYVNFSGCPHPPPGCGKLLWRKLWRMWKTLSFQQVFAPLPNSPAPVDNAPVRFA